MFDLRELIFVHSSQEEGPKLADDEFLLRTRQIGIGFALDEVFVQVIEVDTFTEESVDIYLIIILLEIFGPGDLEVLREPGEILFELAMDLGRNAIRFCFYSFLPGLDGRHGRRDRRCARKQQWRGGINASEIILEAQLIKC